MTFTIRQAIPEDAEALTKLAKRSKAHWGYSADLIKAWEPDLTITPEFLVDAIAFVAEKNGKIAGFWARSCHNTDEVSQGYLFVESEFMGQGCATQLWQAVKCEAKNRGLTSFVIEADPNAAEFYLKIGGIKISEKESPVVPGRYIPIIKFTL
ncbi:MAG: GNAT family N-acetyltransferase [Legionellales bacterium]|nr:GNAT family N-acetyltransferase [Legionellales bacterium]|tara:strand:+ start:84993 stop:85451 length:459 start_codon:yes stop_codon:yes gene_type:complete